MSKKRILIIEDEHDLVELIMLRLEANGYEAMAAYDGEEGLRAAKEEKPDLIVLDVMMPKMNGFDVCRKLKDDEKFKRIPILMLTVKFQPNDIKFAKELGADEYLTKPFEPEILLNKIRELLKV